MSKISEDYVAEVLTASGAELSAVAREYIITRLAIHIRARKRESYAAGQQDAHSRTANADHDMGR
jgi:hypothetical protein